MNTTFLALPANAIDVDVSQDYPAQLAVAKITKACGEGNEGSTKASAHAAGGTRTVETKGKATTVTRLAVPTNMAQVTNTEHQPQPTPN